MSEKSTTVDSSELDAMESRTDWDRLNNLSDEDIKQAVDEDPDAELLDTEWFKGSRWIAPEPPSSA
jgi:hypothetical protein